MQSMLYHIYENLINCNITGAAGEAAFMTGLERNSDIV